MTKYFDTISKTPQNDKVVIDVEEYGDDSVREYICGNCNFVLHARKSRGEIDCPNCNATVDLGSSKTQQIQTLEDPNKDRYDSEPGIVSIEYDPSKMAWHTKYDKPKELKGGALALSKKGIRFTSYYDSSAGKEGAD